MSEAILERVGIDGPRGRLSGTLAYRCGEDGAGAALLVPPHPYMGGRMDLPLLMAIAEALAGRGIISLGFDYGGVGDSEGAPLDVEASMQQFWSTGTAPEDPILIDEAMAARRWLGERTRGPIALVGYSYGAFAVTRVRSERTPALVLIAPTIARHDYAAFGNDGTPTLIIHGDDDFAGGEAEVERWAAPLPGPTQVRKIAGGSHFFRGLEADVAAACGDFLEATLTAACGESS